MDALSAKHRTRMITMSMIWKKRTKIFKGRDVLRRIVNEVPKMGDLN